MSHILAHYQRLTCHNCAVTIPWSWALQTLPSFPSGFRLLDWPGCNEITAAHAHGSYIVLAQITCHKCTLCCMCGSVYITDVRQVKSFMTRENDRVSSVTTGQLLFFLNGFNYTFLGGFYFIF